jgi:hypothetical protein
MDAGAPRTRDGGNVEWDEAGWIGFERICAVLTFSGKRRVVKRADDDPQLNGYSSQRVEAEVLRGKPYQEGGKRWALELKTS